MTVAEKNPHNVEILHAINSALINQYQDMRTLGEELISIEMCDNVLEDFYGDRREDFLGIFESEGLEDSEEFRHL
ncbi:hypothetical protein U1Q18_012331 [Sarracenia purpurea var. burkii]